MGGDAASGPDGLTEEAALADGSIEAASGDLAQMGAVEAGAVAEADAIGVEAECGESVRPDARLEMLTALEVAVVLGMQPHREGGYFKETFRSTHTVLTAAGRRSVSTAILFLLTGTEPSRFHKLRSDELWLYHAGSPAELVLLGEGLPEYQAVCLNRPQAFIPAERWMAARVLTEDETDWGAGRAPERRWTADRRVAQQLRWTLVSCVVTPGFDYADFELGDPAALLREFPRAKKEILALT